MTPSAAIRTALDTLLADSRIQKALQYLDDNHDQRIEETRELVVLQGAPFCEGELRSPYYRKKLEAIGLENCVVDKHDNAFGAVRGSIGGRAIFLEAHLDTVFPKDTPLEIVEKDGRLYCPGISDDTSCLAVVLSVARAIKHAGLEPVHTLFLGGSSGEEGEGDLRGVKGFIADHPDIAAHLPMEPGPKGLITKGGLGSKRYEFTFTAKGGHSWSAFGLPSPIHAMCRAVAKMADVPVPENPRTSYTVGTITGGTSVNSIPFNASCKLDMRSLSAEALADLEKTMLDLVREAVEEENALRAASGDKVAVEIKLIGDRPAGDQSNDAPIVQAISAIFESMNISPNIGPARSTNANVAINKGIPAVVVRAGYESGNHHNLEEWFKPEGGNIGSRTALLMLFLLGGLNGVTDPLPLQ